MTDWPIFWADGLLTPMFHLGPSVAEKALRAILVYLFLLVLLRVFGKRELAQLNPFDLVVLLSLSNTLQNAIIGDDTSITGGLIGAFTLCAFNYLVVRFLFRHRRLDQIIEGKPTVLIDAGRVQEDALARELISSAELLNIVHRQGFSTIEEIQSCTLEPGGTFCVEAKKPPQDDIQHTEILTRLDELARRLDDLNARLGPPSSPTTERNSVESGAARQKGD